MSPWSSGVCRADCSPMRYRGCARSTLHGPVPHPLRPARSAHGAGCGQSRQHSACQTPWPRCARPSPRWKWRNPRRTQPPPVPPPTGSPAWPVGHQLGWPARWGCANSTWPCCAVFWPAVATLAQSQAGTGCGRSVHRRTAGAFAQRCGGPDCRRRCAEHAQTLEQAIHEAQPRPVLDGLLAQLDASLVELLAPGQRLAADSVAEGLPHLPVREWSQPCAVCRTPGRRGWRGQADVGPLHAAAIQHQQPPGHVRAPCHWPALALRRPAWCR